MAAAGEDRGNARMTVPLICDFLDTFRRACTTASSRHMSPTLAVLQLSAGIREPGRSADGVAGRPAPSTAGGFPRLPQAA
jgi:hypothetical protein